MLFLHRTTRQPRPQEVIEGEGHQPTNREVSDNAMQVEGWEDICEGRVEEPAIMPEGGGLTIPEPDHGEGPEPRELLTNNAGKSQRPVHRGRTRVG